MITPQVIPEQPTPDKLHDTTVFGLPVTVAVNCTWPFVATDGELGETVTLGPETRVTVADADCWGAATAVAVTLTVGGFGADAGAVYNPAELMVPQLAPLQPAPEMDQVTAVFVVPVTVAVNCFWLPVCTWTVDGDTLTETAWADSITT